MAAFLRGFDLKLVLLGDRNSGKSALLHQFCLDDFHDLPITFDTAFAAKRLHLSSGRPVALAIWDTAGSLKFQHITRMFIRGADVVLACFDITNRQHWERLKVLVHEARTRQPNAWVYIIATKIDLLQPDQGSQQQQRGATTEGVRSGTPSLASLASSLQEPRSTSRPQSPEQSSSGGGEEEGAGARPGGGGGSDSGQAAGGGLHRGDSLPSNLGQQQQQRPESLPESSTAGGCMQQAGSSAGDEWEYCTKASSRQQLRFEEPAPSRSASSGSSGRPPAPPRQARQQAVPDDELELYVSSVGARLFKTSAKTGEGVMELFQTIAEEWCRPTASPTPRGTSHPASSTRQQNKPWAWHLHPGSPQKVGTGSPATPATPQQAPPATPLSPARHSMDSEGGNGVGAGGQESGRQPGITQSLKWGGQHWHQGRGGGEEQRRSHQLHQQQQKQENQQPRMQRRADGRQEYVLDELAFAGDGQQRRMQGPAAPALEDRSSCTIM